MEATGNQKKYLKRLLTNQKNGKKINADLNGAINIMRKKVKIEKVEGVGIFNPKVVNIFRDA